MNIRSMLLMFLLLPGCSMLFTYPYSHSQAERFASLPRDPAPVTAALTIYWEQHAIPFVDAANDDDLAFGVGVVHAHLRLGQMEVLRLLAQGRLSEALGPVPALETIDHAVRVLDFCRAGEAALAQMSERGQRWMRRFAQGINWYVEHLPEPTIEHRVFDLAPMGFSVRDLMCITRLASSDLSWMYYTKFLKLAELEGWQDVLALARHQVAPALSDTGEQLSLQSLLRDYSKSGSNSVVVAGTRSRSGSALIANDPHVGLTLPNFWLMVGLKSPDYHAFGLMIPGIPVIGVGRNPDIAWGGTNMRGISSHLYDVSTVPTEQIRVRRESKVRRFWFDSEHVVRETAYGNIFSDVDYFSVAQPLALDWIGHRGSDELTTFLDIARARDWDEFRSAFDRYRISAMNMLYADRWGNIGMIAAYGQPVLRAPERTLDLVKQTDNPIVSVLAPTGHHIEHNPEAGFIASANNRPPSDRAIPFSFAYANNDRAQRLTELVQRQPLLGFEELRALQLDTHSASALQLVRLLVSRMSVAERPLEHPLYSHLLRWNGNFDHANPDALACEMVLHFAWQSYLDAFRERPAIHHYLSGLDGWKPVLLEWLQGLPQDQLESLFAGWLAQAVEVSRDYASWGAFHRQIQAPVLARLPLVGARFALDTYPADGNNDTLNKSGRRPGTEPSVVTYGASARHISDLASLDENYFVLHGGQDGWLMNPNLADQTTLWRAGQYIRIPLDMDKVRAQFTAHVTRIEPE